MSRVGTNDAHCRLAGVRDPTMIVGVRVDCGVHMTRMFSGTAIELIEGLHVPRELELAQLFDDIIASESRPCMLIRL